jgi:hypothetical protein
MPAGAACNSKHPGLVSPPPKLTSMDVAARCCCRLTWPLGDIGPLPSFFASLQGGAFVQPRQRARWTCVSSRDSRARVRPPFYSSDPLSASLLYPPHTSPFPCPFCESQRRQHLGVNILCQLVDTSDRSLLQSAPAYSDPAHPSTPTIQTFRSSPHSDPELRRPQKRPVAKSHAQAQSSNNTVHLSGYLFRFSASPASVTRPLPARPTYTTWILPSSPIYPTWTAVAASPTRRPFSINPPTQTKTATALLLSLCASSSLRVPTRRKDSRYFDIRLLLRPLQASCRSHCLPAHPVQLPL